MTVFKILRETFITRGIKIASLLHPGKSILPVHYIPGNKFYQDITPRGINITSILLPGESISPVYYSPGNQYRQDITPRGINTSGILHPRESISPGYYSPGNHYRQILIPGESILLGYYCTSWGITIAKYYSLGNQYRRDITPRGINIAGILHTGESISPGYYSPGNQYRWDITSRGINIASEDPAHLDSQDSRGGRTSRDDLSVRYDTPLRQKSR